MARKKARSRKNAATENAKRATSESVTAFKHPSKRKNIPPAGLEAHGYIREAPTIRYEYNPHLPPVLRSGPSEIDRLPELLQLARKRALTDDEAKILAEALRKHEPWLEWSGKREKPWFEVEPVALHMHERISTQAVLRVLAREDLQRDLFADPQQEYAKAVRFYEHDVDWTNRMILGDSLQVMASLAKREDLAGKVQMIYIDPPYGISFKSNFQPSLGQRDVKDRDQDLTREPEMVKAYRDTWTLGIHSYLAYLRDRLAMAKELLADTGSIFVQISDENLHRVRCLMDDVFGIHNFCAVIPFVTTSSQTSELLSSTHNYLLWFARDRSEIKFNSLYRLKDVGSEGGTKYKSVELATGERLPTSHLDSENAPEGAKIFRPSPMVSQSGGENSAFDVEFEGEKKVPRSGYWKTNHEGIRRLMKSGRVVSEGRSIAYVRYLADFPVFPISSFWEDTWGVQSRADPKLYVVQTATQVIERCLLMTTDPGDLVLDPTCGSGTTAYVAEQWGRRWITCDTSRVALALARQRLMTARFPFYKLRSVSAEDIQRNPHGAWLSDPTGELKGKSTFQCKTVPHITLKSIARNTSLDPIFAKHEPILNEKLESLNKSLRHVTPETRSRLLEKLERKRKEQGKKSVTDADRRRWMMPKTEWKEWEVPFDTDPDWPKQLQDALVLYREAWRAKMDEVNACINANAEMEELVDKPEPIHSVVRVSGPFTMEGVIAVEEGPDSPIGGAPEGDLETFDGEVAVANAEAHLDKMLRLLKASGVDFEKNKTKHFTRLEPLTGSSLIHAEGEWVNGERDGRRVAVSIGPEVGNITAYQVEEAIRAAHRRGYDDLVFVGFGFDAAAQAAIEEDASPRLQCHMFLIRPDVAMGDLLKTQPGSQIFTRFSAPRVKSPERQPDGQYVVEVEGMDVYDPVTNTLYPTDRERIAAWFLDSDYDNRTFCICQAFFPDKTKWQKLAKALGEQGVIDEDRFEALSGLRSLPFPKPARLKSGESWRVAVKVIDPRGNEGLRVVMIR
ncbi:MAG: DNA methyltransferase [Nitrospiraceae bacterium]